MGKKELADNMKNLRLMKGYTVTKVAEFVNRAPNTIINWETGKVSPDIDVVESLSRLYQIPPDQLLGWSECPELEEFKNRKKNILDTIADLQKQKADIEARLRYYTALLDQKD